MGLLDRDGSQIGDQCRERIISDFGFGIRNAVDDAGLADARGSNQCNVSQQLKFQHDLFLVAGFSEQAE